MISLIYNNLDTQKYTRIQNTINHDIIQHFGLGWEEETASIKTCVKRYSLSSYHSPLFYIGYRILQIVLAVLGQSDWQKARGEAVVLLKTKDGSRVNFDQVPNDRAWNYLADKLMEAHVEAFDYYAAHAEEDFVQDIEKTKELVKGVAIDFWMIYQKNNKDAVCVFKDYEIKDHFLVLKK